MKNILIFMLLIAIPASGFAQKKSIRKFYRQYKKMDEVQNFVLPGFVFRLGAGLAKMGAETKEEKEVFKLARSVRQARILMSEEYNPVDKSDFNSLVKSMRKTSYEDLISIREEETQVQIMVHENGKKIKGLLLLVSEEDEFFLIHLKTRLHYKRINQLLKYLKDDLPLKSKEKEATKVIPIA